MHFNAKLCNLLVYDVILLTLTLARCHISREHRLVLQASLYRLVKFLPHVDIVAVAVERVILPHD